MTKHGLTDNELHIITSMCAIYPEIESVVLFGSRAMGNFKTTSDVDIAIKGRKIDVFLASRLKRHIEDGTDIPYLFDVIDYNTIDNANLKKHIDEEGVVIFSKERKVKNKTATPWFLLSLFIIFLDQWSKFFVATHFTDRTVVHALPFLNFILRFNNGAAFSFLSAQSGWQIYLLSGISVFVSIILIAWLWRLPRHEWVLALPVSLVLGGAIGNLIDRVHYGFVIDFIDFHVGNWHYATFNIADSAVCVGAIWLVLRLLYEGVAKDKI